MARGSYAPLPSASAAASSRPSLSFSRRSSQPLPSSQEREEELDAAFGDSDSEDESAPLARRGGGRSGNDTRILFDADDDDDEPGHSDPLRSRRSNAPSPSSTAPPPPVPGAYDFERDYASFPPAGSPPLAPSTSFTRTNAPASAYARPGAPSGEILPHPVVGGGVGNDGVFANLSAKPVGSRLVAKRGENGVEYVREDSNDKEEAPPSYNVAALDATPPYWDTTVIAPSSGLDGDDLVVEGLPVGTFFSFAWNLLVSFSFQFVGFLLTYLLHTTHAAKNGARAGLGITLIQYGFYLRTRTADLIANPPDPSDQNGNPFWGGGDSGNNPWGVPPPPTPSNTNGTAPVPSDANIALDLDSISTANDWISFILMSLGWFVLLTSVLSYWRVTRWANSIRRSTQQANANAGSGAAVNAGYPGASGGGVIEEDGAEEGSRWQRLERTMRRVGRGVRGWSTRARDGLANAGLALRRERGGQGEERDREEGRGLVLGMVRR